VADKDKEEVFEKTRDEIFTQLRKTIPPEFLNRIDEVIMFKPLDRNQILQIVEIQFDKLRIQLQGSGIEIKIKTDAIEWLANQGFDPQFGARPVKRVIQKHLLNELSKIILLNKIDREKPVVIDAKDGALVFSNE